MISWLRFVFLSIGILFFAILLHDVYDKNTKRNQLDVYKRQSFMAVLSGTSSELFSKISLTGAGIMLTWFLTKSLWLPANVKFKAN